MLPKAHGLISWSLVCCTRRLGSTWILHPFICFYGFAFVQEAFFFPLKRDAIKRRERYYDQDGEDRVFSCESNKCFFFQKETIKKKRNLILLQTG